ncbi:hypothetical protein [Chitinophaga sp. CF418]|uniref:hypothetical protein n=1 Tax=Chitinophaga sp. CF418 TaxID=1855287 RepID=UPI00091C604C|nr:hypothetical protein [Chitinophaga sp. CF418]SHN45399.1 hypothetical protein SAMN05216311_12033 [Chitinophaga sp. CF418]
METTNENEKPKMYIITGHKGAGKTNQIADLLPDHPFVPDIYRYNEKTNDLWDKYLFDKDLRGFLKETDQEMDALDYYINKQIANRQNIYIEMDVSFEIKYLVGKTDGNYDINMIYLVCNSLQQSIDVMEGKRIPFFDPLDEIALADNYKKVNFFVNGCAFNYKDRIEIYQTHDQRINPLVTIDRGNIVKATTDLREQNWLSKNAKSLYKKIERFNQRKKSRQAMDDPKRLFAVPPATNKRSNRLKF